MIHKENKFTQNYMNIKFTCDKLLITMQVLSFTNEFIKKHITQMLDMQTNTTHQYLVSFLCMKGFSFVVN